MLRDIEKIKNSEYDLLVIGGGINGAGIANIASGSDLKVVLLEKRDFASGTSSKSTKLIHGGLRYLENLEFGLVSESLRERYIQLKAAPHLVKPLGFIIPVYKGDKRPLWMVRFGVSLYNCLAGRYKIKAHRNLSIDEILHYEPGIKKQGLLGGVMYYDCQMDDARLCLENILSASEKKADVANYAEVISFLKEKTRVVGVKAKDNIKGTLFEVRAKRIVCAVGPWTNILLRLDNPEAKERIRTTKGIHIVYPGQISRNALLIPSDRDNRIFFIIPWMGNSLIGTTDTDYRDSPDKVKAETSDVDYLIQQAKRVFPDAPFSKDEIIATFAGLRPLLRKSGSPSKVSRRHVIFQTPSGIIFVIGGKYTTYRKISEDCVGKLVKVAPSKEYRIYGSADILGDPEDIAKKYSLDLDIVTSLISKYGSRYKDVIKLIEDEPQLKERVCLKLSLIKAQIIYSLKVEMAQTEDDIIFRRLSIGYCDCKERQCQEYIKKTVLNYKVMETSAL